MTTAVKLHSNDKVRYNGIICRVIRVNPDGTLNLRPEVGNWLRQNVGVNEVETLHGDNLYAETAKQVDQETGEITPANGAIVSLSETARSIAEITTVEGAKTLRDKAALMLDFAKKAKLGLAEQNRIAEIKIRLERKLGDLLREMDMNRGTRGQLTGDVPVGARVARAPTDDAPPTLAKLGISWDQSSNCQQLSAMPEDAFEAKLKQDAADGGELTTAGMLRSAKKAHVSNNSGENEWYTPAEFIEAARATMGSIDLDPASSEIANQIVRAETFYTLEDDGLAQDWYGNVWLNPPYAQPEIGYFAAKVIVETEHVRQICILVNNATETAWFQSLLSVTNSICMVRTRIKFLDTQLQPNGAPLQGQIILYAGENTQGFADNFNSFGAILDVRHVRV